MPWQIALVLFFGTAVSQALIQRSYSQTSKLPESFPPAISYLIGVTPLGIIVGLLLRHHVDWSWQLVGLLVIEGIFIGLYNWLSFKAIRRLPLAQFQTIYQSYEFVVIILGWVLLKETLSGFQVIGGLLLLVSALVAIKAQRKITADSNKSTQTSAIVLTLLAALVMGIGLVAEKAALGHMDIGAYFIFGYGTQTVALVVLARKDISRKSLRIFKIYDLKRSLAMGILSATTGFFYIAAIVGANNISLITALSAFALPLIVMSGYIFLHERDNQKMLWSSMSIGFLGLLLSAVR